MVALSSPPKPSGNQGPCLRVHNGRRVTGWGYVGGVDELATHDRIIAYRSDHKEPTYDACEYQHVRVFSERELMLMRTVSH